jgi:outer membrane autotransporter protein
MSTATRVAVLLAGLCAAASAARAQYPQRRDGFWIGFGLGYGWASVRCDNCVDSSSVGGITGFLKLGGAPSRHLLIGAAVNGWSHANAGLTETMANVTASLYLYPRAKSGFFLTSGLGFSKYHVNSVPSTDGTGWGLTAGAGYDIRFGRDVSLTPVANLTYGALADFDAVAGGGTIITARGWKQTVLDLGLGVTFH